MMLIPVEVAKSKIHGLGVFALSPIKKGTVVWQFEPGLDRRMNEHQVDYANARVREFVMERGYLNDSGLAGRQWIVCVDEAQFLNFPNGEKANTELGGEVDGEGLLLAQRNIEPGEEITVPPESDGDYERKIKARAK